MLGAMPFFEGYTQLPTYFGTHAFEALRQNYNAIAYDLKALTHFQADTRAMLHKDFSCELSNAAFVFSFAPIYKTPLEQDQGFLLSHAVTSFIPAEWLSFEPDEPVGGGISKTTIQERHSHVVPVHIEDISLPPVSWLARTLTHHAADRQSFRGQHSREAIDFRNSGEERFRERVSAYYAGAIVLYPREQLPGRPA